MKAIRLLLAQAIVLSPWFHSTLAGNQSFNYDAAGRLVAADYGAGKSVSYAYDNAGNLIQSTQPAPGVVVGAVVGNQFMLSWPAAPGGFVLESSVSIGAGANWSAAGLPAPALNGNLQTVSLPIGGTTKFFRLRKL